MIEGIEFLIIGLAAIAAGAVNALAGGGTLISFPILIAVGVPPVNANVTNTVSLIPGYLGATFAQLNDLRGQGSRLWWLLPVGAIGGLVGGVILLATEEALFSALVPYLILFAAALLAIQEPLRARIVRRLEARGSANSTPFWSVIPVVIAAIYGGYFGAGVSVIVLAVLGLVFDDSLTRLNALKQAISFSINITAAIFFIFSGEVVWPAAAVMAVGALIGGAFGGRIAGRIQAATLRLVVVVIGVVVAAIYLVR
ncbi:MAG: sulfite exporter TauE/SafE family protein [Anaerolineae bacterium]|nr:sulfite exporter TauE/SafE family protein [Anaerolineae bacterium]